MPNLIPTSKAEAVRKRDPACLRCGMTASETHHRRTRSVDDEHQHCTCVLVRLCRTCHSWVHAHPLLAKRDGLWISRHEAHPFAWPVRRYDKRLLWLDCDGTAREEK